MRSQVEQFHFVVHYSYRNLNGGIMNVETNLSVFDQKTLAIVQTIADRRMFGFVGKGNFFIVPVRTGSGEIPLYHIRIRLFEKRGRDGKWYQRSYASVQASLKTWLALSDETPFDDSERVTFDLTLDRTNAASVKPKNLIWPE
ncbi:TPA_asm: hypothetical protein [ssRNA phage SRR6960509_2]|uniref:Uncharacterized protein n=1 Tax=ssRNA phage SRR6960509_2 TaxID=2786529 RepID=A0A8S5L4E4_9VIRU|nr:hypothetical protein QII32_gp3 [ssRNA phage SRR6960509_2]DAD52560.1 TPA_asm: hypothetical protein [ssRNA phage SRR6960509_2]